MSTASHDSGVAPDETPTLEVYPCRCEGHFTFDSVDSRAWHSTPICKEFGAENQGKRFIKQQANGMTTFTVDETNSGALRIHRIERPLTQAQHLSFAAILSDEFSPEAVTRLGKALHGCLYTATALRMLAQLARLDNDDPEGAELLERMARQFAELEATQV